MGIVLAAACGKGISTSGTSTTTTTSVLATAYASSTASSGTLLCSPQQAQLDACAGLAAGDACTLTGTDGTTSIDGTCRATLDGTAVACSPTPPAPPQELVEACADKALSDACTVTEPDGDTREGVCVTARDGATVICGRQHTPPQAAVDACASAAAGDACSFTGGHDGAQTISGVCALGPGESGVLACVPAQQIRPGATEACAGLAGGDACTLGGRHAVDGTCVVPAAGGDAVCVPGCGTLGGPFACHQPDGHHHGGGMDGGMGPGAGMP
ncbi:MAG: hypothetical protein QM767_14020 [Anaeromyxobacter sp.]